MAVVLGGILWLRLHAFLALSLAAFLVAGLTPSAHLQRFAVSQGFSEKQTTDLLGKPVGKRVATAFGVTCGKIGILIALAAVIGKGLLQSGAADRMVRSTLRCLGERRAPLAFLGSGFTLAVPVFFDTVFYLMIPLAKALGIRSEKNYGLYIMAIIAGGTMAHSLVPPTPGPLLVAGELGVDLGAMILGGIVVGSLAAGAGCLYAVWINRRYPVPLRDSGNVTREELESSAMRSDQELPPLAWSVAPVILPVILIAGATLIKIMAGDPEAEGSGAAWSALQSFFKWMGDPNIALAVSAGLAIYLMHWKARRDGGSDSVMKMVQGALSEGGVIILITAAGGAFGGMLREAGLGWRIQELALDWRFGILPLAFLVTFLVRTAQGSATVAMITSVGIVGALATQEQLGFSPLYVALAIGCGSKPFPWMNDSGFWVINKMSGMTVPETFRSFSVMLTLMGTVGLLVVMVLAKVFPLV
jgi:GntP family gluconate:H+ symporter